LLFIHLIILPPLIDPACFNHYNALKLCFLQPVFCFGWLPAIACSADRTDAATQIRCAMLYYV
jgi:hypothetical protein